ncbi:MAG: hypothetical protein R3F65_24075 [bacterium]
MRHRLSPRASRLSLAVALLAGAALPIVPATAIAQDGAGAQTMEDVRDQGVLYFRKNLFKQAMPLLDKAYGMPGGKDDFTTVYFRAQAAYRLLLLETAFEMSARAAQLTEGDSRREQNAKELQTELDSLFGKVTLKAAEGETNKKGRIFFETRTGIINKEKRQRFQAIQERFKSTDITLPITVYLPYGDYLANKVPVTLAQGEPAPEVEIYLQVQREEEDNTMMWVGIGAGTAAAVGLGVGAFLLWGVDDEPAPKVLSFSLPGE